MNNTLLRYQRVKEIKKQPSSNDKNSLEMSINSCSISLNEEVQPDIEAAVPDTEKSSISSDDTECLTPDFELPNSVSIFSEPTQRFEQYTRPSDTPDRIYSATTQEIDKNFHGFHYQVDIDDNLMDRIWTQCKFNQHNIPSMVPSTSFRNISSSKMSTQKNIETNNLHAEFIPNFLNSTVPGKAKAQSFSSIFLEKTSNEQQNMPIFDIDDINDFTQLATPNVSHLKLPMVSETQSSSVPSIDDTFNDYRKIPEVITERNWQGNYTIEVVVKKEDNFLIKNELKRKTKTDRREDKENDSVIINFQQEKRHAKKLGLDVYTKNSSTEKRKNAFSPESVSPENKKRRLTFQVSPFSLNRDWESSLFPRGRKKRAHIVDLTQEDNTNVCSNDEENEKNSAEKSSVVLRNNPEEKTSGKAASEVKLSTIASSDSWDIETTAESSLDVTGTDTNQNESQKSIPEKRSAIVVNNPTEKRGDAFSSDSASPENKKRRLSFKVSPIFVTKDCESTPFHLRRRKKRIHFLDLTQEDDTNVCKSSNHEANEKNATEESSVFLRNNPEEKTSAKPATKVKLSTIAISDSSDVETTAESSQNVADDDKKQNASQKTMAEEKRSAIVVNDSMQNRGDAFTPDSEVSLIFVIKDCGSTPFHLRRRNKRERTVDLTQEDDTNVCKSSNDEENKKNTAEKSSVVLRNNPEEKTSAKPATKVKLSTIAISDSSDVETTAESSQNVADDDKKQNASQKTMAEEKRSEIVVNDSMENRGETFTPDSEVSPIFVIKDCGSTPFHLRRRNKRERTVDLTQEDDTNVCKSSNDEENKKNTAEKSSVVLRNNLEEKTSAKPASEVKLSTIASSDSWDIETTAESFLDVTGTDRKQNESQKSMAAEKRSAIVVNDPTEMREDVFASDSASPENKKRRLSFQVSPISVIKYCALTPVHPRGSKERVRTVDLTEEEDTNVWKSSIDEENENNTAEESLMVLRNNPEQKTSAKPASESKLATIASIGSWDVQTSTKSFLNIADDDKKQNALPQSIVGERKPATIVNDAWIVKASPKSSLDLASHDSKQNALRKSIIAKNRSAIVISGETLTKSSIISQINDDVSSSTSTTTNFTQSNSFTSTLLSDRCSEYDNCLQDDNLSFCDQIENLIGAYSFAMSFHVGIDVINQQVSDILVILDADIAAN